VQTVKAALQGPRESDRIVPIWAVSHNAAEAFANAAKALDVEVVIGASPRAAFYHMLRGHIVKGLMKKLPMIAT
jgi:hypothetical protein